MFFGGEGEGRWKTAFLDNSLPRTHSYFVFLSTDWGESTAKNGSDHGGQGRERKRVKYPLPLLPKKKRSKKTKIQTSGIESVVLSLETASKATSTSTLMVGVSVWRWPTFMAAGVGNLASFWAICIVVHPRPIGKTYFLIFEKTIPLPTLQSAPFGFCRNFFLFSIRDSCPQPKLMIFFPQLILFFTYSVFFPLSRYFPHPSRLHASSYATNYCLWCYHNSHKQIKKWTCILFEFYGATAKTLFSLTISLAEPYLSHEIGFYITNNVYGGPPFCHFHLFLQPKTDSSRQTCPFFYKNPPLISVTKNKPRAKRIFKYSLPCGFCSTSESVFYESANLRQAQFRFHNKKEYAFGTRLYVCTIWSGSRF